MSFRIGSFNLYKFSYQSDDEIRKDVDKIVQIIYDQQFGIIALQEVFSESAFNMLLKNLGTMRWDGCWSAPDSVSASAREGYAYIWDKRKFRLSRTQLDDGSWREYIPRIYKQYRIDRKLGQCQLIRNPYYARFEPTNGANCELRLINTHIMFARSSAINDVPDSLGNISMRKNEFMILTQALYSSIADKVYRNNRPAYTIILGDYNLNLRQSRAISSAYIDEIIDIEDGRYTKRLLTTQTELTTLKMPPKDPNAQDYNNLNCWANNYDHFTYDLQRFEGVKISVKRHDSVTSYCNSDYKEHRKTISDHVPIIMDINIKDRL